MPKNKPEKPKNRKKTFANKMLTSNTQLGMALVGTENDILRKQNKILNQSSKEILLKLKTIDPTEPKNISYKQKRLQKLLAETKRILDKNFKTITNDIKEDYQEIADTVNEFDLDTLADATPFPYNYTGLPAEQLKNIAIASPFGQTNNSKPRIIDDWMKRLNVSTQTKIEEQFSVGMVQGESIPKLRRRLSNIVGRTKNNLETIVRTGVQHLQNATHLEIYKKNNDVIKGVRLSTMRDQRVCLECINLSRAKYYKLDEIPKQVPIHPNCRCTWVPVTFTFKELGIDGVDEVPVGHRGFNLNVPDGKTSNKKIKSWIKRQGENPVEGKKKDLLEQVSGITKDYKGALIGQTKGDKSYQEWFSEQPDFFKKSYLGTGMFDLYKKGGLTLDNLYNSKTARRRTIADVKRIYKGKLS